MLLQAVNLLAAVAFAAALCARAATLLIASVSSGVKKSVLADFDWVAVPAAVVPGSAGSEAVLLGAAAVSGFAVRGAAGVSDPEPQPASRTTAVSVVPTTFQRIMRGR
jgi:hypothetical protein